MGGLVAFIAAWMVGPRYGKYNPDGSPNVIHGHNLVYIVIGTLTLISDGLVLMQVVRLQLLNFACLL